MNSIKNLSLAVLAVAAVGAGIFAWNQSQELAALRAAAADTSERDALKKRAADAEKRARDLGDQLASAQTKLSEAAKAGSPPRVVVSNKGPDDTSTAGAMRSVMNSAANMTNRPEMQKIMALNAKAALDGKYAALFKQLALDPNTLEQFKKLMVERQTVGTDVFTAAMQQGLDPMQNRKELAKLTADAQGKVDGEIKSLIGDSAFGNYQQYEATQPQRSVVNQLQQALSYTANPLTETQAEQVVAALAANAPPRPAGAGSAGTNVTSSRTMVIAGSAGDSVMSGSVAPTVTLGRGSVVTDAGVNAASAVLSPPQVEALKGIQQQQAQISAAMQAMGGGAAGQPGGAVFQIHSTTTTSGDGAHPPVAVPVIVKPPGGG